MSLFDAQEFASQGSSSTGAPDCVILFILGGVTLPEVIMIYTYFISHMIMTYSMCMSVSLIACLQDWHEWTLNTTRVWMSDHCNPVC
eukprot:250528-Amphidinium_carterae.2